MLMLYLVHSPKRVSVNLFSTAPADWRVPVTVCTPSVHYLELIFKYTFITRKDKMFLY